jgi:hypothetical protein
MKPASILLGIPFTILCVAAAAQNNPNPPPPQPQPSRQTPVPEDTTPPNRTPRSDMTNQHDQQDPTATPGAGRRQGGPAPFETLDRGHAGYLSRDDARGDPWLARHFERCDADRDTRVTRAEYEACTRAPSPR